MSATTIKLDARTRDRLNSVARKEGVTAGSMVERLLDLHLREVRFAQLAAAIEGTSADDLASYVNETEQWESSEF